MGTAYKFFTSDELVEIGPEIVGKKLKKFAGDFDNFIQSDKKEKEKIVKGVEHFYTKEFKKFNWMVRF